MERVKLVFIKCKYEQVYNDLIGTCKEKNIDYAECDIYDEDVNKKGCEEIIKTLSEKNTSYVFSSDSIMDVKTKDKRNYELCHHPDGDDIYKYKPYIRYYENQNRFEESETFKEPLNSSNETHEVLLNESETSIYSIDIENKESLNETETLAEHLSQSEIGLNEVKHEKQKNVEFNINDYFDYVIHYINTSDIRTKMDVKKFICISKYDKMKEKYKNEIGVDVVIENDEIIRTWYNEIGVKQIKTTTLEVEHMNAVKNNVNNFNDRIQKKHELDFNNPSNNINRNIKIDSTKINYYTDDKLDKLINLIEEKITTKTSYELGKVGETSVEDLLKQTFPKLEIQNVASIPHQGDVQMRDYKNDILFMFEIKNKQQINLADINKFKDDVKTLEKSNSHVVGIFISLVSNIPIYGEFNINNNLTYITNKYMNSECLKVIVDSYIYLLKQKLKIETNVQYTIPENVYTLLAKINSEYNDLNNELDILQKQVDYNKASTSSMLILIEKINIRKKFINYIKQEFLKLNITDPIEKKKVEEENEIDKFREYLKSISVWRITKRDLLSNFPNLKTLINENKLEVLIRKYRN